MTRKVVASLTITLCLIGVLTAACATQMTSPSQGAQAPATPTGMEMGVKAPVPSEFSMGPSTPGGAAKGSAPVPSEFSLGPNTPGGVGKGSAPVPSEFSTGPK